MRRLWAADAAIVVCLAELFPDHGIDLGEMTFGSRRPLGTTTRGLDENKADKPGPKEITPVPPGSYEVIVASPGFAGQRRRMQVEENGVTILNADLRPGK